MDGVGEALSCIESEIKVRIDLIEQESKRYKEILNYLRRINAEKRKPPPPVKQKEAVETHEDGASSSKEPDVDNDLDSLPEYLDNLLTLARSARGAPATAPTPGKLGGCSTPRRKETANSKVVSGKSAVSSKSKCVASFRSSSSSKAAPLRAGSKPVPANTRQKSGSDKSEPHAASSSSSVDEVETISPHQL